MREEVSDKRGFHITVSVVHVNKDEVAPPPPHPEVLQQQLHDLVTVRQDVGHQRSAQVAHETHGRQTHLQQHVNDIINTVTSESVMTSELLLHKQQTCLSAPRSDCDCETGSGDQLCESYLILCVVLQSDGKERLKGLHVFLEVAAQNCKRNVQSETRGEPRPLNTTRHCPRRVVTQVTVAYLRRAWTRPSARPPARLRSRQCSETSSAGTPSPRLRSAGHPDAALYAGRSAHTQETLRTTIIRA